MEKAMLPARVFDVLTALSEGSPLYRPGDPFLLTENPLYRPDNGQNPRIMVDMRDYERAPE